MVLFAQALGEYAGASSNVPLGSSANVWDRLRGVDQQTWLLVGGVLVLVMLLTLRSKRR